MKEQEERLNMTDFENEKLKNEVKTLEYLVSKSQDQIKLYKKLENVKGKSNSVPPVNNKTLRKNKATQTELKKDLKIEQR